MPDAERTEPRTAAAPPVASRVRRLDVRRGPLAALLVALVALLVAMPLLEGLEHGRPVGAVLLTIVLASAVLAISARRSTFVLSLVLVVPAITARWIDHYQAGFLPPWLFSVSGALFLGFVIAHLLAFILRAPRVDSEVLCAGIATYLLLALVWTLGYLLIAQLVPGAFEFTVGPGAERTMSTFNALYFSFVTLSTVGYGDIVPVAPMARMLAILEATTGLFYVTILIARLVSLYSTEGSEDRGGRGA